MRQSPDMTRGTVRKDAVAGFVNAVVSVPDGLASATLAGVTLSEVSKTTEARRPSPASPVYRCAIAGVNAFRSSFGS